MPRPVSPSLLPPKLPLPVVKTVEVEVHTVESQAVPLFTDNERRTIKYRKKHNKRYEYRWSEVDADGMLRGDCGNCKRGNYIDMIQFEPADNKKNARRRPQFFEALRCYYEAYDNNDIKAAKIARETVENLRHDKCLQCRVEKGHLSPAQRACKDEYDAMRKKACKINDGCANPNCIERGEQAWCVLQGNHVHTARETNKAKRKVHQLGSYVWWSWNGGVPAMRAEEAKGIEWICGFCHDLEPTGNQANRYSTPETMPEGKCVGTREERKQYHAKWKAIIRHPKHEYVDKRKQIIGCCQCCKRSDVIGHEWCFHFDHRDESTKMKGKRTLAGEQGGVCGLVQNTNAQKASLHSPGFKAVLDAEMDKCDLLCHNCHHRKTHKYPMRV